MKTVLAAALLWVLASGQVLACDVCGCAVGGSYLGILPQFRRHFAGVRFQYRTFDSEHPNLFGGGIESVSKEQYLTAETWGRWTPLHNVQVFGFVPYHHFSRTEDGSLTRASGLGDASVVANWGVFNTGDSTRRAWKHALQLGGGVKLPIGNARLLQSNGEAMPRNMQPGSGSVDFPLNAMYTLRHGAWGMTAEGNYRINTPDAEGYRFGHRAGLASRIFYWKSMKHTTMLPGAGIFWEHTSSDRLHGAAQDFTGGHSLWAGVGMDWFMRRWAFSILYQHPLAAHIGEGYIQPGPRASAGISYLF